jgi:hypothetical protein
MEFAGRKFMRDYSETDTEFKTLELTSITQLTGIETERNRDLGRDGRDREARARSIPGFRTLL